jgi:hypothetical protein
MEKLPEGVVRGNFAGKEALAVLRDKMNEIIEWINEFEKPVQKPIKKSMSKVL